MDDEDPELAAIRARMRQEILQNASGAPKPESAPESAAPVHDIGDTEFDAFVRSSDNVVVDCWAPWCGPCRIVSPIVEELAREMSGRARFAKLNVDLNPGVSQAFGVMSIPTLLVFRRQQLVDRVVGALPKQRLAAQLERHFGRRSAGAPGPRRM